MEGKNAKQTSHHDPPEVGLRVGSDRPDSEEKEQKGKERQASAEQTTLFADHRKDEVVLLFGHSA